MIFEEMQNLIKGYLEKNSWASAARSTGVSENTMRGIIEGKTSGHHNKLIKIVHGLAGVDARNKFVTKYKDYSPYFQSFYLLLSDSNGTLKPPGKDVLGNPKFYEILMFTGCRSGIAVTELESRFPHRSKEIQSLIHFGIVEQKSGRYYSTFDNEDPEFMFDIIKTKIELRTQVTREDTYLANVYGEDERVNETGAAEIFDLASEFVQKYRDLVKKHHSEDGILVTVNSFVSTFGINEDQRSSLLSKIGVKK